MLTRSTKRRASAAGLWVALLALALGNRAHAQCSKDTDCKGDRVCVQGSCASPGAREPLTPSPYPGEGAPPQEQPPPPEAPPPGTAPEGPPPAPPPPPPPAQRSYPPPPPAYRPYRRYYPQPAYVERKLLAARFGLLGGLGLTADSAGRADGGLALGLTGGLGLYFAEQWGIMGGLTWNITYPGCFTATAQLFFSSRLYWAALGLGVGAFPLPGGYVEDTGLALDGIFLFKVTPWTGVGFQLETIQDPTVVGTNVYFSALVALQFVY